MLVDRFDHAVIAVPDLDAAADAYRGLGFDVGLGGTHAGRGTHNAIIRFGLDYLELIAIHDRALGLSHGGNVGELIAFLDRTGGGLLGCALASSDLDAIAANWSSGIAPITGVVPMERVRPDGFRLRWRLLIPGGSAWRRPWPFLIQWETPDVERLQRDGPATHRNRASGVAGVRVMTSSVNKVLPLYAGELGMRATENGATEVSASVGRLQFSLFEPTSPPEVEAFEREGEGLYEVHLLVGDLLEAAKATGAQPDGEGRIVIDGERACGARLVLIAAD